MKFSPFVHCKTPSFTLTMWDVKGNFDEIIYGVDFGFTLTMWDVKQFLMLIFVFSFAPFYLNYVGCKVSK